MVERKPSSVAAYLRSGKRPGTKAWTGGQGRQGPLGAWLLREKDAIVEGRSTAPALTWREVADLAAADGVTRPGGSPYAERDVSKAWSNLLARKLVPRNTNDAPKRSAPPARGQGGAASAGGDRPPAPGPPATPSPVPSGEQAAKRAPERPRLTATDMPRRRRFGDED